MESKMKAEIVATLEQLAIQEEVSVLYACESGSRAWGFASTNSDYDVRFIYLYPMERYLTIERERDTIELPVNEILDVSGWDLRKTLQLMRKSNPVIFEWLQSPIVYSEWKGFKDELFLLAKECFSAKASIHHYLGGTRKSIQNGALEDCVKVKTYFYALRPLLSAMWIAEYREIPPMEFHTLLKLVEEREDLLDAIRSLLHIKKEVKEADTVEAIPIIRHFIRDEFERCEERAYTLLRGECETSKLDSFFRMMLSRQGSG